MHWLHYEPKTLWDYNKHLWIKTTPKRSHLYTLPLRRKLRVIIDLHFLLVKRYINNSWKVFLACFMAGNQCMLQYQFFSRYNYLYVHTHIDLKKEKHSIFLLIKQYWTKIITKFDFKMFQWQYNGNISALVRSIHAFKSLFSVFKHRG